MRGVTDRRARFVCAAAWSGEGRIVVRRGVVDGRIVDRSSGEFGFGYDPYFHADELGMTLAAADLSAKQRVSHRARAFHALLAAVGSGH